MGPKALWLSAGHSGTVGRAWSPECSGRVRSPCQPHRAAGSLVSLPQYMGCIEVLRSMRSLDFNTRTQVTR